jgi:alcohol dehydrogenase
MKTRAAVLREAGRPAPYAQSQPLTIEEVEVLPPRAGEVLVRMASAGLCHSDLSHIDGTLRKPFPIVLGHEAAGIVEAVGPEVVGLHEGDHVVFAFVPACGRCDPCLTGQSAHCEPGLAANMAGTLLHGGTRFVLDGATAYHHLGVSAFAERVVAAQESLVRVPPDVPFAVASFFGCAALTGLGAVFNAARVEPGASVAIFGGGGVGLMAVLGALAAGATDVLLVDPLPAKRALARELGATVTIDPAVGEVAAQVREHLRGRGVAYVIEAAGTVPAVEAAIASSAPGGTVVVVGLARAGTRASFAYPPLVVNEITIRGSMMGSSVARRDVPRAIALWRAGKLPVEKLQSGTTTLDGLNAAFDRLAAGEVIRTLCTF